MFSFSFLVGVEAVSTTDEKASVVVKESEKLPIKCSKNNDNFTVSQDVRCHHVTLKVKLTFSNLVNLILFFVKKVLSFFSSRKQGKNKKHRKINKKTYQSHTKPRKQFANGHHFPSMVTWE